MSSVQNADLYEVLGSSPSDSVQQLRHRYQQLVLQYHPDRLGAEGSSEAAVRKFLEVDAAWKTLSDQDSRRQYDLQRRAQELKQDSPLDSAVRLQDMSWDQGEGVFSLTCRCGGQFSISEEEVDEETRRSRQDDKEENQRGLLVCCDTCSLSMLVTWSSDRRTVGVMSSPDLSG